MTPSNAFCFTIYLTLVVALSSGDVSQDVLLRKAEERELVTREMMESYLSQQDDVAGPVINLVMVGAGSVKSLSSINYSRPIDQVALDVANAVIPVIGTALAFIPGVGPVISGLFLGIWGLISPLFAAKQENPMEKMIKEFASKLRIEMDEKLSKIINRAIHGEITRNNYICTKYNFIFQNFAEQLKNNIALDALDALELSAYMNDCDNFLKDTAEAFVYDEYADVLWVPSAITTFVRISFLTEVIKYSHLMGIRQTVSAMYFQELKNDTRRQFTLYHTGYEKMRSQLVSTGSKYNWPTDYLANISQVEKSACLMQSELLYFDRELYPYGMPTVLQNTDIFAEIKMEDHYKPDKDGTVKHLQVFFDINTSNYPGDLPTKWYLNMKIMNCIMGPMFPIIPSTFWFLFHPMPAQEFSYEFRVMYFHTYEHYHRNTQYPVPVLLADKKSGSQEYKDYAETHSKLNLGNPEDDGVNFNIKFIMPDNILANGSKQLIDMPIVTRWEHCPYEHDRGSEANICSGGIKFYNGMFRMYSAGTYNVKNNEKINKLIRVGDPGLPFEGKSRQVKYGFLLGVEIIMRPTIVMTTA